MATKTELLDAMEAQNSVLSILNRNPTAEKNEGNMSKYHIPFVLAVDTSKNLVRETFQPIVVLNEGQTGEEIAYYHGSHVFDYQPTRSQLYTDSEYINGIENQFPSWTVLDLTVRINEDTDVDTDTLIVKASDGTFIVKKEIDVWNNSNGDPQFKIYK